MLAYTLVLDLVHPQTLRPLSYPLSTFGRRFLLVPTWVDFSLSLSISDFRRVLSSGRWRVYSDKIFGLESRAVRLEDNAKGYVCDDAVVASLERWQVSGSEYSVPGCMGVIYWQG